MANYVIIKAKFGNKGKSGVDTIDNIIKIRKVGGARSIQKARQMAYDEQKDHKGRCVIYEVSSDRYVLKGEVQNTVWDIRYWYPSKDGMYCAGGKYTLYKTGKLGKRLR